MPSLISVLLTITLVLIILPEAHAFGAGDIPDFSYLQGKAFRHGDIENTLLELVKSTAVHSGEGGLLSFASSILGAATGGAKFSREDVKRVYFGNWLRDYSQAMDIAGLSKLSADTLVLIVSILGFLTFGFATEEFQVTADRLGVYLPVEHIDNPKGYAQKEGDARQFHPRLRPPVDPRELEIDQRTGMKNYMATEGRGWDTSTAFIRRTFHACIGYGRRSRGKEGSDLWEAFRLLGQGLHTLEDFTAHSNWCEVALRKLGYHDVFCHVGDNVFVNSPGGRCPPIVTGTFGGADFLHSLMGEATDHISQSSVTDLSEKMKNASSDDSSMDALKGILAKFRSRGGDNDEGPQINQAEDFRAKSKAYHFDPDNVMPPNVQQQLFSLLKWRDGTVRDINEKMQMIPGLADLMDTLSNALNAYVYTIIAPYVTPLLTQVTTVLGEGSKEVIDSEDQYEVFDNPNASDPTHSLLSKDHFQIILNEPAGKIAQVVITNAVNLIVQAWSDNEDPNRVIDQILEAFHHPYYASGRSQIQNAMFETIRQWIDSLGDSEGQTIIQSLTKEGVRAGKNKRGGSEDEASHSASRNYGQTPSGGYGGGYSSQESRRQEYDNRGVDDSYGVREGYGGQAFGSKTSNTYGDTSQAYGGGYRKQEEPVYGTGTSGRNEDFGYSGDRTSAVSRPSDETLYGDNRGDSGYGRQKNYQEEAGYGADRPYQDSSYVQERERKSYRDEDTYGGRRPGQTSSYAPSYQSESYEHRETKEYGGDYQEKTSSYAPSYETSYDTSGQYGGRDESSSHRASYETSYNTSGQHGSRDETGSHRPPYQPSAYESGGYASGDGRRGETSSYAPSYQPTGYEPRQYGGEVESSSQYTSQESNEYRNSGEREHGHGHKEKHHGGQRDHSGERRHGRRDSDSYNEETFGAERLSLNDDEGGAYRSERRRGHGNDYESRY